jgi:hypothetical protein
MLTLEPEIETPILPQELTVAEALERAAEMIAAPGGWCQNKQNDGMGGHCAADAMLCIADPPLYLRTLGLLWNVHGAHLIDYNDTLGRTQQEVVNFLMAGANEARARGL